MLVIHCAGCGGGGDRSATSTDTGTDAGLHEAGPVLPSAPLGVIASDGTSSAHVTVTWEPVPDAIGYDVYRDGILIASDVSGTSYEDTGAEPGGAPMASGSFTATDGYRHDDVQLIWSPATTTRGAEHTYTVVARTAEGESEPGGGYVSSRGYRAGEAVSDYEFSTDGTTWTSIGTESPFEDTTAPSGIITPGVASASDASARAFVALALTGQGVVEGAVQTYRLRAINAVGPGPEVTDTGYRGVGDLTYQWQRSAGDADSGYAALGSATTTPFDDTSAPANGDGHYYRCIVSAAGAAAQTSTADRGHRYAGWSDLPSNELWMTDGSLGDVAYDNGILYLGGSFSYVGPYVGAFAAVDATTGQVELDWPKVDGWVRAIAPDGSGGWFIGGQFSEVDGIAHANLAHIDSTGALDTAFDPHPSGPSPFAGVDAMVVSGNTLYVGGDFIELGDQPRRRIAAIDATTGAVSSWDPGADARVLSLVVDSGAVYAAGNFTSIGGQPRSHIAAIDEATGSATSWNPNADGSVLALAVSGSTVYAGGHFSNIGGQAREHIAAIETTAGNATGWNPNADGVVRSIALDGDAMYVGGDFTHIGGLPRNFIARVNAATGLANLLWNPDANSQVTMVAVHGATIHASGYFSAIGGQPRTRLAALDTSTGNATSWDPGASDPVDAVAISGGTVYVGGNLGSVGGVRRRRLAALDTATGTATAWDPGADDTVSALALIGNTLYVGGRFTHVGGQARNRIAALDVTSGAAADWDPNSNNTVSDLILSGNAVYARGDFTSIGGQSRTYLAGLDATTGLATDWNPNPDHWVRAMAIDGGTVYVGGLFSNVGGQTRNYLAALDAASGLATEWAPVVDNQVWSVAVDQDTVYAGGEFDAVGGQPRNSIAAIDAATAMPTTWNPGANHQVSNLLLHGGMVYAGGGFSVIGGVPRSGQAELDATTGVVTAWEPEHGGRPLLFAGNTAFVGASGRPIWVYVK